MRHILLFLLLTLLLTACAQERPFAAPSPLPDPIRLAPTSLLPSPPATASAPAQSTTRASNVSPLFVPNAGTQPQPAATPTPIVIDFAQTSPGSHSRIQRQLSTLVIPLLGALESAAPRTRESLLSSIVSAAPRWANASHRSFLPLIVKIPGNRLQEIKKLFNCDWAHRIPRSECEALLLFYLDTNGDQWREHRNWLRQPDPCIWGGMQCYDGHVRVLQVENNGLTGVLPPEIKNLPITFLLVANNALTGSVPDSLVRMTQLQSIELHGNRLTGTVHPDIAKFPELHTFTFDRDKLRFNTDAFRCEPVTTIPQSECEALVAIYRSMGGEGWDVKNVYTPAPTGAGHLFASEWLVGPNPCHWRGINCLEGHVDILNLSDSNARGRVSPAIGKLTRLGQLNLSRNFLYGPLPLEIQNLSLLWRAYLGGTQLPSEITTDPRNHLCIPLALAGMLAERINETDMPPGGFCQ